MIALSLHGLFVHLTCYSLKIQAIIEVFML